MNISQKIPSELYGKLLKVIEIRLFVVITLFFVFFIFYKLEIILYLSRLNLILCFLALFLNLPYFLWLRTKKFLLPLGFIQLTIDEIMLLIANNANGAWEDPLAWTITIPIIVASFILPPRLCVVLILISILSLTKSWIMVFLKTYPSFSLEKIDQFLAPQTTYPIFYLFSLIILIFLVGTITIYLNETIEKRHKKIQELYQQLKTKQEEEIKKEKIDALGKFATKLSGELRQPLSIINAAIYYLKILAEKISDIKEQKELKRKIDAIERAADSALKFAENLTSFSEVVKMNFSQTNLNLFIKEYVKNLNIPKEIKIEKDLSPTLQNAELDQDRIKQLLDFIIKNSIEAMPNGGTITIKTRFVENSSSIELVITDTGIGIPKENLEKVWEPFYTTKPDSNGLGFTIIQKIVEGHRGTIELKSKPNEGTSITIRFPLVQGF